jgi:Flp pilus assembly protein TadD
MTGKVLLGFPRQRLLRALIVGATVLLSACAATHGGPAAIPSPPKVSPDHLAALSLQLVSDMEQQQKWYAAISYLDAYHLQHGSSPEYDLLRARALAATGEAGAARESYAALSGTTLAAFGEQGLGLLDAKAGKLDAALRHFRRAVQIAPTNASMLNDLGYAYLQQRDLTAARPALYRAGELAPDNSRVWSNIALYLLLQGETFRAQEIMGNHHLSWHTQQRIHQLAEQLGGSSSHPADDTRASDQSSGLVQLPQAPLSYLFTRKESTP